MNYYKLEDQKNKEMEAEKSKTHVSLYSHMNNA